LEGTRSAPQPYTRSLRSTPRPRQETTSEELTSYIEAHFDLFPEIQGGYFRCNSDREVALEKARKRFRNNTPYDFGSRLAFPSGLIQYRSSDSIASPDAMPDRPSGDQAMINSANLARVDSMGTQVTSVPTLSPTSSPHSLDLASFIIHSQHKMNEVFPPLVLPLRGNSETHHSSTNSNANHTQSRGLDWPVFPPPTEGGHIARQYKTIPSLPPRRNNPDLYEYPSPSDRQYYRNRRAVQDQARAQTTPMFPDLARQTEANVGARRRARKLRSWEDMTKDQIPRQ
jgi:hypothetical protein